MNEWIPVSSGNLPEEYEKVQITYLGYNDGLPRCDAFAYLDNGEWCWDDNSYNPKVKVNVIAWRKNNDPYIPPVGKITAMNFDVRFDRRIDRSKHYISPGGYEFISNGKPYRFDFCNFCGMIDENNPTILHAQVYGLDEDYSSDMSDFNATAIEKFEDFYIFTCEAEDPELIPVEILSLEIEQDGTATPVSKELLKTIKFE